MLVPRESLQIMVFASGTEPEILKVSETRVGEDSCMKAAPDCSDDF